MTLIIGFLTAILFLNSLLLVLLVLIQLPKKDAGAGLAFGGGATDALFGAGSGNALTQITKYSAGLFLGLALILTILNKQVSQKEKFGIDEALEQKANATSVETGETSTPTEETSTETPVETEQPAEPEASEETPEAAAPEASGAEADNTEGAAPANPDAEPKEN